jgi:hypothetical protein
MTPRLHFCNLGLPRLYRERATPKLDPQGMDSELGGLISSIKGEQ